MKRTFFARPGTNEQFVDMREPPACPEGMIQMQSERQHPDDIANDDGTWADGRAMLEKAWAMRELSITDRAMVPDFPETPENIEKIKEYRGKLRNPARTLSTGFPDKSWRPEWPAGVKRPAV